MKILIVGATLSELSLLIEQNSVLHPQLRTISHRNLHGHDLDILATGIGMVNTAFELGKYFSKNHPDLAFNIGIAGTFLPEIKLGSVIQVRKETFSEMGAEDQDDFLDLEKMGFTHLEIEEEKYFNSIGNPNPSLSELREVRGITVNKVHGNANSIEKIKHRLAPEVETMEGAAFFQACMLAGIPFHEIRAISNLVEPRDRSKWKIEEAIQNGQLFLMDYLKKLPV